MAQEPSLLFYPQLWLHLSEDDVVEHPRSEADTTTEESLTPPGSEETPLLIHYIVFYIVDAQTLIKHLV